MISKTNMTVKFVRYLQYEGVANIHVYRSVILFVNNNISRYLTRPLTETIIGTINNNHWVHNPHGGNFMNKVLVLCKFFLLIEFHIWFLICMFFGNSHLQFFLILFARLVQILSNKLWFHPQITIFSYCVKNFQNKKNKKKTNLSKNS